MTLRRNMLPSSSGQVKFIKLNIKIIGRRNIIDYMGRLQRQWMCM